MTKLIFGAVFTAVLLSGCNNDPANPQNLFKPIAVAYPVTFRDTLFADTLHGVAVADPFRWMEAEEAPILQEWLDAETKLSQDYLSGIAFRDAVAQRVRDLWNFERVSGFRKKGAYFYYFKNSGLQAQDVFCRRMEGGPEEILLDPNSESRKGGSGLGQVAFSANDKYLAYEVTEGGTDWKTIRIYDLEGNKDLADTLRWVKYSNIAWAGDGFYYSRYPAPVRGDKTSSPMEFHQVFFHKVGTGQSADQLVFADRARSRRGFLPLTSEDGRFLVLQIWETHSGNGVYVMDLKKASPEFVPVVDDMANEFSFIGSKGDHLFFLTNFEAGKKKLIKVSIAKPDPAFWEDLIPEKQDLLKDVALAGGKLIAHYLRDAQSILQVFEADGTESSVLPMQEPGTISDLHGQPEEDAAYFSFESFLTPPGIYELDLNLLTVRVFKPAKVNFNASVYETRQQYFKSPEGVNLSLFITLRKGVKLDGGRPTLLTGNGSFAGCSTPRFDPMALSFLENGGILAQAVLRGGGEYGREWYESGSRSKKQNTFDDFQAAAGYLISQGYTKKEKLAIAGSGPGGLLAGVSINQRPDLFQAAVATSGMYDMLRYQHFTIGGKWSYDFGRSEMAREFDYLNAWSPVHNVQRADYPATLVITGDKDDRVYPAHSYKFAAELQAKQKGQLPILLLVEKGAGELEYMPVDRKIRESADVLSFIFFQLKQPVVYEFKK